MLTGGGQAGALLRSIDWSENALGPVSGWPQSLRTVLSILLGSEVPVFVLWGPELVQFYNDSATPILGSGKHPTALGQRARYCWKEIWDVISPMYASVLAGGSTTIKDGLLVLDRNGFLEECYFDYAYSPIRDESGGVAGIYAAVAETTGQVIGGRRLALVRELSLRTTLDRNVPAVFASAEAVLAEAAADLPFALIYLVNGNSATLVSCAGLMRGAAAAREECALGANGAWPLAEIMRSRRELLVEDVLSRFGSLVGKAWPEPVARALLLPLSSAGEGETSAILVAGLSPRLQLDDGYRGFLQLLARQLAASLSSTRALEQEQQRASALAELDRQKTDFFSNVSHEFRTPLTLILGPTEEALASASRALQGKDLERVHRNAQRLLKLVNTLLEFSRVEAGKSQATFLPTDLARLTSGLVNAFESVLASAGIALVVDCPPLPEPLWVDPTLWEKVVLNLVSNAFKFTLAGQVAVRQRWVGNGVELSVEDTGAGIGKDDLPRIFERFYRVEGTRGRSHEGSGIGLSLVRELARLHAGHVSVTSTVGMGSKFSVFLPAGRAHVATAHEATTEGSTLASAITGVFVREATHWLPESLDGKPPAPETHRSPSVLPPVPASQPKPHVLLADDNADMRQYVQNVLETHFTVEGVSDGEQALQAIRRRLPDVIVSDVMMPRLDGVALTRALRADARTAHVPVVLLSARAGEGATVEGLDAGADDYVVKPFGARELVARVQGAVKVARTDAGRRRALERVAEVMDSIGDGFFSVDAEWRITTANPSFERLSQTRRQDVLGEVFWEVFPAASQPEYQYWQQYHTCMQTRVPVRFVEYYAPLGLWSEVRANPTPDGGIAVFFRDISAEKETEAIRARQAEFEQQLIGIVSHDLRTPLNAIQLGASILARREELSDGLIKTVVRVQNAATRAARMVNDLLDFTQARLGGGIPIHPVPTDVHAVVHAVLVDINVTYSDRQVLFSQAGEGKGEWDPDRLAQAVQNLVTNALKYSPGGTLVQVSSVGEADRVVLAIHNSGPAIAEEVRGHLFEPFRRGSSHDIAGRSVGLGLYIVQQVVDAHQGRIEVTSTDSDGTTFVVTLPRRAEIRAREYSARS